VRQLIDSWFTHPCHYSGISLRSYEPPVTAARLGGVGGFAELIGLRFRRTIKNFTHRSGVDRLIDTQATSPARLVGSKLSQTGIETVSRYPMYSDLVTSS